MKLEEENSPGNVLINPMLQMETGLLRLSYIANKWTRDLTKKLTLCYL